MTPRWNDSEMAIDPNNADVLSALEGEALEHIRRLMSESATLETLEAAELWESSSPARAEAMSLARRLWSGLGPVGRDILERDRELFASERQRSAQSRASRRALLGGVAAAAAMIAGYAVIRPPFDLWPSISELRADYRTETGEQRQVVLGDGLTAALNTRTSIATHPAGDEHDHVELVTGEAVISATSESRHVHALHVGDGRIDFQDASVNVRFDGHASCAITCLRGSVRVARRGAVAELQSDRLVAYSDGGLSPTRSADANVATAWRQGLLIFHQAPLSQVIAEINRYRRGRIVLLNAPLGRRTVNARFAIDGVDDILLLAQREFGAVVRPLPGGVVVLT
jgi:transmembrane sensor